MKQDKFVFHISETFLSTAAAMAIGVIISILVARGLGPDNQGLYAVAFALVTLGVQFGCLGLNFSNTYLVSKNRNLLSQLIGNTLLMCVVLGLVSGLVGGIIEFLLPWLLTVHGLMLVMVIVGVPIALASYLLQSLILGIQEIRYYNVINLGIKFLWLVLILILVLSKQISVSLAFLAFIISLIVNFLWSLFFLKSKSDIPFEVSNDLLRHSFSYGLKAYFAAFFAYLVLKSDLLMIQFMLGVTDTGYYSISSRLAETLVMLPVVIGTIILPRLSAMSDPSEKWELTKKMTLMGGLLGVVTFVILFLFANYFVLVMYGGEYLPAITPFLWLLPGVFFLGLEIILAQYLNSLGFPISVVYVWLVTTLINILLNIVLIPVFGIAGAAVSSSISYLCAFIGILMLCFTTNNFEKKTRKV